MRERTDHSLCAARRQVRIGVETYDQADVTELIRIPGRSDKAGAIFPLQKLVELFEFPSFSLPPHPAVFRFIPEPAPVKQVKWRSADPFVVPVKLINAFGNVVE